MSLFAPSTITLLLIASLPAALPAQTITASASAPGAVQDFMRALADSNLTRMAELFGNASGPVAKTKPKGYEKKIVVMQLFLHGVQAQTLGEVPGPGGMRTVMTQLSNHGCKATIPINVVKAPEGWLVHDFKLGDAAAVNKPCDHSTGQGTTGR